MRRVLDQIERLAPGRGPVLIDGEPGSGKRRVAEALHERGPRRAARFVATDAAAPGFEAALFGGDGAEPALALAEGGTLYVARIGAAPAAAQVRLLRLVRDRVWEGAAGEAAADVRLVAAGGEDLGALRADLHERIAVARIAVPPLRERIEDLPELVRERLRAVRRRPPAITAGALEALARHPWPGNVRELEALLAGLAVATPAGRPIGVADLPPGLAAAAAADVALAPGLTLAEAGRLLIEATLRHTGGDKPRAAALLGIGLRTLYRKLGAGARRPHVRRAPRR